MSAVELFGAEDFERGVRYFKDGTTARDVDALDFGIATTGEIEVARAEAKKMDQTQVLVRLAEIINNIGTIISRHKRLRTRDGKNKPPFFYQGRVRRDFDGRTPWWVTADRRESYLNVTFLEEHGTIENIMALLASKAVSSRILLRFERKTPLREEIASRLRRAHSMFVCGEKGTTEMAHDDDDPVQDLASAVRNPDDWCRPHVSLLLRESALAGLRGPLAALYPSVMTDQLLHQLWQQGFVPDEMYDILYRSGMTAQELIDRDYPEDDALRVDTGELNGVLAEAAKLAARAG